MVDDSYMEVGMRFLPQLLAVLPQNSRVLGFQMNSFHSLLLPSFAIFFAIWCKNDAVTELKPEV